MELQKVMLDLPQKVIVMLDLPQMGLTTVTSLTTSAMVLYY